MIVLAMDAKTAPKVITHAEMCCIQENLVSISIAKTPRLKMKIISKIYLDRIRAVLFVKKVDAGSHVAQQRALPCEIQARNLMDECRERLQVLLRCICVKQNKLLNQGQGQRKRMDNTCVYFYISVCGMSGREKCNGQTDLMIMCSGIGMRWSSARFTKMDDME